MIHTGDCLDVLPTLEAESIDAIVTDPPYGLEFMGKEWDKIDTRQPGDPTYVTVDNPYGRSKVRHGAAASYGSSSSRAQQEWHYRWAVEAFRVAKPGAHLLAFGGTRTYHRLACAIEDAGWEVRDCLVWAYASGFPKSLNLDGEWQGWGTALKPAWEPIILARKPLRGTVARNVQEYGTGALNIDGCRIGDGPTATGSAGRWPSNLLLTDPIFDGDVAGVVGGGEQSGGGYPAWRSDEAAAGSYGGYAGGLTGRQPFDTSGTYSRFFLVPKAARPDREPVLGGLAERDDLRGASVMQYHCAKCGKQMVNVPGAACSCDAPDVVRHASQRKRANHHPTVKPTELMRHLVRLVTPPGGTVLDPFLGSGTTALAAEAEGFAWAGIEREPEYVLIAEARLNGTQKGLGL